MSDQRNGQTEEATVIESDEGKKTILSGDESTKVPFVDELGVDADRMIQERVAGWREEGKKIDLDYSLIVLQVAGQDLPDDLDSVKVVVGGRGSVGERMSPQEFIARMSELMGEVAEMSGRHDPFLLLSSLQGAFNGFVEDMRPVAERREHRGRLRSFIERRRTRDEEDLIGATNRYMRVVKHILETGSMDIPEEAQRGGVSGLEDLSRDDFGKKK